MPNALDLKEDIPHRIFAIGPIGTGKSTTFLTLPGKKKFMYITDPSGASAYRGYDVDYEAFLQQKLNFTVEARPKGGGEKKDEISPTTRLQSFAYAQWEAHFMDSLDDGFFDQFDLLGFDSITTFIDIALDDVTARAGRLQYPPEQGDYNVVKIQVARMLRAMSALNKPLLIIGHTMYRQNQTTQRLLNEILITGDLQVRAPMLFSSVLYFDYSVGAGDKKKFTVQSGKDSTNENLKTDIKGLSHIQDVTITDWSATAIQKQGLGKFVAADIRRVAEIEPRKQEEENAV